jgi:outer membrane protein
MFDSSAVVKGGGAVVPGLSAEADDNTTLLFDISRKVTPRWKVRFFGGFPPETTLKKVGSFAGIPNGTKLGKVTYAPAVLSATYDLPKIGKIQPYVGGGVNYTLVYNEKDKALNKVKVDNGLGAVVQIGADMDMGNNWTVGLDVRKIFVSVDATAGSPLGDVAIDLKLDPTIVWLSVGKTF